MNLESTLLLGYFGVNIFVNKMFNSHVGPTRLYEEKSHHVQQLHPWLWPYLKLRLQHALPAANQTHFLLAPAPTSSTHICVAKNITVALQKSHCGCREIRPTLLTNYF